MVTVEPGLRWYLAEGQSGLWCGATIPASYQSFGATGFWGDTETIGVAPSVGFSHRFDSGLVVQLSAGPVAQITLTQMRSGSPGIGFVGGNNVVGAVRLRAGIGAGWAF